MFFEYKYNRVPGTKGTLTAEDINPFVEGINKISVIFDHFDVTTINDYINLLNGSFIPAKIQDGDLVFDDIPEGTFSFIAPDILDGNSNIKMDGDGLTHNLNSFGEPIEENTLIWGKRIDDSNIKFFDIHFKNKDLEDLITRINNAYVKILDFPNRAEDSGEQEGITTIEQDKVSKNNDYNSIRQVINDEQPIIGKDNLDEILQDRTSSTTTLTDYIDGNKSDSDALITQTTENITKVDNSLKVSISNASDIHSLQTYLDDNMETISNVTSSSTTEEIKKYGRELEERLIIKQKLIALVGFLDDTLEVKLEDLDKVKELNDTFSGDQNIYYNVNFDSQISDLETKETDYENLSLPDELTSLITTYHSETDDLDNAPDYKTDYSEQMTSDELDAFIIDLNTAIVVQQDNIKMVDSFTKNKYPNVVTKTTPPIKIRNYTGSFSESQNQTGFPFRGEVGLVNGEFQIVNGDNREIKPYMCYSSSGLINQNYIDDSLCNIGNFVSGAPHKTIGETDIINNTSEGTGSLENISNYFITTSYKKNYIAPDLQDKYNQLENLYSDLNIYSKILTKPVITKYENTKYIMVPTYAVYLDETNLKTGFDPVPNKIGVYFPKNKDDITQILDKDIIGISTFTAGHTYLFNKDDDGNYVYEDATFSKDYRYGLLDANDVAIRVPSVTTNGEFVLVKGIDTFKGVFSTDCALPYSDGEVFDDLYLFNDFNHQIASFYDLGIDKMNIPNNDANSNFKYKPRVKDFNPTEFLIDEGRIITTKFRHKLSTNFVVEINREIEIESDPVETYLFKGGFVEFFTDHFVIHYPGSSRTVTFSGDTKEVKKGFRTLTTVMYYTIESNDGVAIKWFDSDDTSHIEVLWGNPNTTDFKDDKVHVVIGVYSKYTINPDRTTTTLYLPFTDGENDNESSGTFVTSFTVGVLKKILRVTFYPIGFYKNELILLDGQYPSYLISISTDGTSLSSFDSDGNIRRVSPMTASWAICKSLKRRIDKISDNLVPDKLYSNWFVNKDMIIPFI